MGKIEDKIAAWSQLPHEHGEFLYYLKYDEKQEYKPHFDSFDPEFLQKQGISVDEGNETFLHFFRLHWQRGIEMFHFIAMGESGLRICTVLIYLRAPIEGGETSFPNINLTIPIGTWQSSSCKNNFVNFFFKLKVMQYYFGHTM